MRLTNLSKEIRQQDRMVVIGQHVVGLHWRKEVARNELVSLMDQLIECMLSIGSRLTPNHRTGTIGDRFAILQHDSISTIELVTKEAHNKERARRERARARTQ
jgi:hypothetical protein